MGHWNELPECRIEGDDSRTKPLALDREELMSPAEAATILARSRRLKIMRDLI